MGLHLLTVKTYTKCTIVYRSPEKQIVQVSKIQKCNALPGTGKPETYRQNQQPSKVGYGRYYVPTDNMHKQRLNIN